mgnify:CR=1 FL=1
MARRGRCGMVIIDYLQLLDTASRNTNSTREREIAAASRSAKLLAKELDVPVILLSQLSRKIEERTDKTPMLSDLRESGAIEQDADMVLFIDRPAMYGRAEIDADHSGRGRRAAAYRQEPGGGDRVRDFPAQRKYYTDCGL